MNDSDQYHAFAADYEWLFSDTTLSGDSQIEGVDTDPHSIQQTPDFGLRLWDGFSSPRPRPTWLRGARHRCQQQHGDAGTRTRG